MDASGALADLAEISSQIEQAVVFEEDGSALAWTPGDETRAQQLATTAVELVGAAEEARSGGVHALTQLEIALREGSVFVVREEGRSIVATAAAGSPSGLVLYDLRTCLRSIDAGAADEETRSRSARGRTTADA
jgi:predicted regulator of Ras-like GTPase activity (Roadblock/LC7/MglB family)